MLSFTSEPLDTGLHHQLILPFKFDKLNTVFPQSPGPGCQYWEKTGGLKGSWLIVLLSGKLLVKYSFEIDYLLIFKTRIQTCCMSSPTNAGHI